jgi:hypothetical protein
MDKDVVEFVLHVLAKADYRPTGEQVATLADLYARAVEQLTALPPTLDVPAADV